MTAESWASLHTVSTVPENISGTPLEFYARFKLGLDNAVNHYADRLIDPIRAVIEARPSSRKWFLTSPPVALVPAAANLLCHNVLMKLLLCVGDYDLEVRWLRKAPLGYLFLEEHYGSRNVAGRHRYLAQTSSSWIHDNQLRGASIIFVNDVHVTGAQEACQRNYFMEHGIEFVHWQYLFEVNAGDAQLETTIEQQLNCAGLASDIDFICLVGQPRVTVTTKFLWRLFSLSDRDFHDAAVRLPIGRRRHILQLLDGEGVPNEGPLRGKVETLRCLISD